MLFYYALNHRLEWDVDWDIERMLLVLFQKHETLMGSCKHTLAQMKVMVKPQLS